MLRLETDFMLSEINFSSTGNLQCCNSLIPLQFLSKGIHHLNNAICMAKNEIITLWVCCCLGLGLCLCETVLCSLIQNCSAQIITGVTAKTQLCSVPVFNVFCVLILPIIRVHGTLQKYCGLRILQKTWGPSI